LDRSINSAGYRTIQAFLGRASRSICLDEICPYLNALHDACGTVFAGLRTTLRVLFLALCWLAARRWGLSAPPFSCTKTAAIDGTGNTTAHIISMVLSAAILCWGNGNDLFDGRAGADTGAAAWAMTSL
jgi:hypothetical protein